jgi:hypothetical protein
VTQAASYDVTLADLGFPALFAGNQQGDLASSSRAG